MDDYSLDAVAREVLGEGKAVAGTSRDRLGGDHPQLQARSACVRAVRAHRCAARLQIVEKLASSARLRPQPAHRHDARSGGREHRLLRFSVPVRARARAHRRSERARRRLPRTRGPTGRPRARAGDGPSRNVWVFDFKSLYPSIIRTFNIDPLSATCQQPPPGSAISSARPRGAFRRAPAILPRLLDELFPRREAAKNDGDDVAAHAIKILMNSFYGVLGTSACRFFNPALANSITGMGKQLLLWSKEWFEAARFRVLYGDTDSLFVSSGTRMPRMRARQARPPRRGAQWRARALHRGPVAGAEPARARVREALPEVIPGARASQHARREQALRRSRLRDGRGALHSVEFVGLEVVRRDWTPLAKRVQRELYERLFSNRPVEAYLADIVSRCARRARRGAGVSQEPAQGDRRLHRHDAAARRSRAKICASRRAAPSATS